MAERSSGKSHPAPRPRRMSLREYAIFSELCLKSNSRITPANCLQKRADEAKITKRFALRGR